MLRCQQPFASPGMTNRTALQAEGKQILATETAREAAGECKAAQSTADFNDCFGNELAITTQNLHRFQAVIRTLLAQDKPAGPEPQHDTVGIAGPALTSQHILEEFNRVEIAWQQYNTSACTAAFHQFGGGTGGPSFELQCELKLARDHMRELDTIYGNDLHL
jgi:uncharacterized protein YecT (DUF1311 family)